MARTILMTPETMRTQAAQIRKNAQKHTEIIQRMTNLVLTLDEVWTGEAQKAFLVKYQGMRAFFDSFDRALASFAEVMEQTAQRMEAADQAMKIKINSIS